MIDYNDRQYDSLLEEDDGFITLSGIGLFFYEKFKKDYPDYLERDHISPEDKKLRLGKVPHHGKDRLTAIAKRLLQSPFVRGIINSANNQPQLKNPKTL